jgi:auxin-responsive protein IAA
MADADVDVGTELRLGLPGGGAEAAKVGKRGFEETIDLKLKLPTAGMDEAAAAAVKQEPSAEKAKRPAEVAGADAEKPPAPKYVNLSACPIGYSSYVVISLLK